MNELDQRKEKGIKFYFLSSDTLKVKYLTEGTEMQLWLPLAVKDNPICYKKTHNFILNSFEYSSKSVRTLSLGFPCIRVQVLFFFFFFFNNSEDYKTVTFYIKSKLYWIISISGNRKTNCFSFSLLKVS